MTLFNALLVVHILAAAIWIGGALVGTIIGSRLGRTGDAALLGAYARQFAKLGGPVFGGSGLLVLITGIWMVSERGLDFGAMWISIGFLGWIVSFILGAAVVGRAWYRLGEQLHEPGATVDAHRALLGRAVGLAHLDVLIRVLVVVVMVWRPT